MEEVKVQKKRGPKPKSERMVQPTPQPVVVEKTIPCVKYVEIGAIPYNGLKPQTEGSAGIDLVSQVAFRLIPGETKIIPTGLMVEIPKGYVGFVCSRSGLAANKQIHILNSPGIIDSDYRGEIKAILHNAGNQHFTATLGDRIAQLLIMPQVVFNTQKVEKLDDSDRGEGGLGSTGK